MTIRTKISFFLILPIAILTLSGCFHKTVEEDNATVRVKESEEATVTGEKKVEEVSGDILYNEDGSIDTRNWNTCRVGSNDFPCPPGWRAVERGITNVPQGDAFSITQDGLFTLSGSGAPVDRGLPKRSLEESVASQLEFLEDSYNSCNTMIDKEDLILMECHQNNDDDTFTYSYHKTYSYISSSGETEFQTTSISIIASNKDSFEQNRPFIETILSNLFFGKEIFLPSQ